jgi:vacuolar-type H+-ATPase subunit I/STV1
MTPEQIEAQARARFMILNMLRAMGVAIMLIGMAIVATGAVQPSDLIGTSIFALGFLESLVVPQVLARKWRSDQRP